MYGPGTQSYTNTFTRFIHDSIKGKAVPIPNCPDVRANYGYIHDIVKGHILAMEHGKKGERYILGGENISYRELIAIAREVMPAFKGKLSAAKITAVATYVSTVAGKKT